MEDMSALTFGSRSRRASPAVRLMAACLAAALALSVPVTGTAEALLCSHHVAHGPEEQGGHGDGDHQAQAHHGQDPEEPDAPIHLCVCPHPCGPGGSVGGIPAAPGTLAISSHPPTTQGPAWDRVSLPFFDPHRVPSGPDPPGPSFLR